MNELYIQAREQGEVFLHKNYCLFNDHNITAFDAGAIQMIVIDNDSILEGSLVSIWFADGSNAKWHTKWLSSYNYQFGVAVSFDGKYVFAQTWENGLLCLDANTGEEIWKTKSKRGITSLYVNNNTVVCHQRDRALQIADMHTGEVLKEKRPATAWGFTTICKGHIVCQVTAKRWEMINAETLETETVFSHRDFTGGHEDYCVNHICLEGNTLVVRGFQNVWDNSVKPPKMLPNLEFEHHINIELDT